VFGHHIGHHGGVDVERGLHMARGSICSCRRLAHRRLWLFGKYQRSGGWPIRMAIAFTPISRSNETKASFCVCTVSIVGGFDRLADGARGEPLLTQSAADIADDATVLSTVVRILPAGAVPGKFRGAAMGARRRRRQGPAKLRSPLAAIEFLNRCFNALACFRRKVSNASFLIHQ
jgi:hypothetical protein